MTDVTKIADDGRPGITTSPEGAERDRLFSERRQRIDDFDFGAKTAGVFDDMLDRSVPFYQEIQRMVAELAVDFAEEGTSIYDLGCSTGTSFLRIAAGLPADTRVKFIGLDYSQEMLDKAARKLQEQRFEHEYELRHCDLNQGVAIENASVVLLVLTLQFVRPLYREHIIRSIYEGLTDNGCLILVEKVLGENSTFNRLFINHYYELKQRNGYSQLEIAQKREALENVLVPYRLEENKELLRRRGFNNVDVFFKWYNFCALVAMK
jgi:tRNA (cmo5U34)-methyltransferase